MGTPFINASKEEIAIEKETIKTYNTRPSKKVEEAKARKNKRVGKAMAKIRTKATVIADQDLNESSKMRQIQKLYKKEKAKHKEEKSYVVNKTFKSSGNIKSGRNVKMVDARMDLWVNMELRLGPTTRRARTKLRIDLSFTLP